MRVPHERKKHFESFNRGKLKKKKLRDLSLHVADLRHRENAKFLMAREPARNIALRFVQRYISHY